MEKIYFAHPINIYDEPLEEAFVELIADCLMNGDRSILENPNQPYHQRGYERWKAQRDGSPDNPSGHRGMSYFYDEVLPKCSGCVCLPFLDGRLGLGVAGEAKWFLEEGRPVWMVVQTHLPTADDIKEFISNPRNGLFDVRRLTGQEITFILRQDSKLVIPHKETRLRTWVVYNRDKRPYEQAHLVEMPIPEGFYPENAS